jgi:transposase
MSKVDRNNPRRSTAADCRYTLTDFERDFPDDATCLEYLVAQLYPYGIYCPTCERVTKHHREQARPSYSCQFCGHREHPMVGTIFENSATPLRLWFYAIYLIASTRCGISAKQLERELGVTYKTAWRILRQIHSLLSDEEMALGGTVEMVEAFIDGDAKWHKHEARSERGRSTSRQPVFVIAQRNTEDQQGRIVAAVAPDTPHSH